MESANSPISFSDETSNETSRLPSANSRATSFNATIGFVMLADSRRIDKMIITIPTSTSNTTITTHCIRLAKYSLEGIQLNV